MIYLAGVALAVPVGLLWEHEWRRHAAIKACAHQRTEDFPAMGEMKRRGLDCGGQWFPGADDCPPDRSAE